MSQIIDNQISVVQNQIDKLTNELQSAQSLLTQLQTVKNKEENYENMFVFDKQEFLDKYDFDCDGIVSIIDLNVIKLYIFGELNDDPLFNSENKTYNGKSLDVNNDNKVTITDAVNFVNIIINKYFNLNSFIDIKLSFKQENDSLASEIITDFYRQNHRLPTLEEFNIEYDSQNS